MKEVLAKLQDSADFKFDASVMDNTSELVKGPILPCIIGMCGSGVAFMKVIYTWIYEVDVNTCRTEFISGMTNIYFTILSFQH